MKIQKNAISHNYFEKIAWKNDFFTCGIDEVGRGCLAGPVVVAAAIIPPKNNYNLLLDSKKLTEKQRNEAFNWIQQNCHFSTVALSHRQIDKLNIYQATLLAMKKATLQLFAQCPTEIIKKTQFLLIDAMPLEIENPYNKEFKCFHMNYGESFSQSISAASIVAKVTRDELMNKISKIFPDFGFEQHKGYGTQQHQNAIKKLEKTIIHRSSFISKADKNSKENEIVQHSLLC